MYNLLNMNSSNVVKCRYVNSRRKGLDMLYDCATVTWNNTMTSLQGRLTESECGDEQTFVCPCNA
jgi:hypothetical protein